LSFADVDDIRDVAERHDGFFGQAFESPDLGIVARQHTGRRQQFDEDFVKLARSVYFENDERARIKKDINLALGSAYVEEKSYEDYRGDASA
jgi:hypothetical protein